MRLVWKRQWVAVSLGFLQTPSPPTHRSLAPALSGGSVVSPLGIKGILISFVKQTSPSTNRAHISSFISATSTGVREKKEAQVKHLFCHFPSVRRNLHHCVLFVGCSRKNDGKYCVFFRRKELLFVQFYVSYVSYMLQDWSRGGITLKRRIFSRRPTSRTRSWIVLTGYFWSNASINKLLPRSTRLTLSKLNRWWIRKKTKKILEKGVGTLIFEKRNWYSIDCAARVVMW